MNKKKVAVVFSTGRKTVHPVANMLAKSMRRHGHDERFDLDLIISYDPSFYGLSPEDFRIQGEAAEVFPDVVYTGPNDGSVIIERIRDLVKDRDGLDVLFKPRGYCTQKNRALFHALKRGNDHILFLDDDEYFVAPFQDRDGSLEWRAQDVFGEHMMLQTGTDITNGSHTGYFSPVPSEIDTRLEEGLRERLGRILALGNETITPTTFINTRQDVRYGSDDFLEEGPYEITPVEGVKPLNGGNFAINLAAMREGRIPPYFNPIGARGEDAILGMQLDDVEVMRVPVYTFHDPFQKYQKITEGEHPDSIDAIQVIPGTIDRFCRATIGWVRYAPFLLRMTTSSEEEYQSRIQAMREGLTDIGNQIDEQLSWDGFKAMGPTLKEYHQRSSGDVAELYQARKTWEQIVKKL